LISFKNIPWKKRIIQTLWLLFGIGAVVLFGAAITKKSQKYCTAIQIEIVGAEQHMFLDEQDILALINTNGKVIGNPTTKTNLRNLENLLEANSWVDHAELYFDNNQALQVHIQERQPVARVFHIGGGSFYVDSMGLRLPLSEKISAKVPVFTNFPSDKPVLAHPDSLVLQGVVDLSKQILADSFWMAQIQQVNIDPQSQFELIPMVGNHIILLGAADHLEGKFKRLNAFYEQALVQQGLNTYEKLDIRFSNQVVAVKRGTEKAFIDSALAKQRLLDLSVKTMPLPAETAPELPVSTKPAAIPVKTATVPTKTVTAPATKPVAKPAVATAKPKALLPSNKNKTKKASKPVKNNKSNNNPLTTK
jgi:cell division protein FtsQ